MPEPASILLVEDREDDVVLIRRAFERAQIDAALKVAPDGKEGIAYLAGEGKFSNRNEYPLPWLILLDLKMPGVDGFEVLNWIRQHPCFRSLVVIVLTSSDAIRDVNRAYQLGANSFLIKPSEFESAVNLARVIHQYWLMHTQFPRLDRGNVNGAQDAAVEAYGEEPQLKNLNHLTQLNQSNELHRLEGPFPDG